MAGSRFNKIVSTTGASAPIVLDITQLPFNTSFAVEFVGSPTTSYKVQYTLSNLEDATWTATWFDDSNVGAGTTTASVGNYMFPVQAVRLFVASLSGGSLRLVTIQGIN
jgi:hypothetical protein